MQYQIVRVIFEANLDGLTFDLWYIIFYRGIIYSKKFWSKKESFKI